MEYLKYTPWLVLVILFITLWSQSAKEASREKKRLYKRLEYLERRDKQFSELEYELMEQALGIHIDISIKLITFKRDGRTDLEIYRGIQDLLDTTIGLVWENPISRKSDTEFILHNGWGWQEIE